MGVAPWGLALELAALQFPRRQAVQTPHLFGGAGALAGGCVCVGAAAGVCGVPGMVPGTTVLGPAPAPVP